ncbi:DUF1837 domain-containing protein [Pseudophaeobacter sp.]|uniref:HamA C-terminal domain-containing protein n=1 Tax=Pseudophaeobacter sp. TaxID=1971739 RepID=UPI003299C1A9
MTAYLEPQLKNSEAIKKIVKQLEIEFKHEDGRALTTLLVYLPSEDGDYNHDQFFELVKQGILANFVFSCTEVEKKLGIKCQEAHQELFQKALRKLSKHTAKGELGELILFTLLDVYFGAPKILSKVSMKTNPRMPVFGADAVHGQFDGEQFRLYLGESKLHKDFKSAATAAATSIENAMTKYEDEFDLLDSYMDFPNIDGDLEKELLSLLNPFSENTLDDVVTSPCFIGFSEPGLISDTSSLEGFLKSYGDLASGYVSHFFSKIEAKGISPDETSILMLPFSCVDELVEEFILYMGIKK